MPPRAPILAAAILVMMSTQAPSFAQASPPAGGTPTTDATSANVAVTGEHMPKVGDSKSAGITKLDRKTNKQMKKETTICKGC